MDERCRRGIRVGLPRAGVETRRSPASTLHNGRDQELRELQGLGAVGNKMRDGFSVRAMIRAWISGLDIL